MCNEKIDGPVAVFDEETKTSMAGDQNEGLSVLGILDRHSNGRGHTVSIPMTGWTATALFTSNLSRSRLFVGEEALVVKRQIDRRVECSARHYGNPLMDCVAEAWNMTVARLQDPLSDHIAEGILRCCYALRWGAQIESLTVRVLDKPTAQN